MRCELRVTGGAGETRPYIPAGTSRGRAGRKGSTLTKRAWYSLCKGVKESGEGGEGRGISNEECDEIQVRANARRADVQHEASRAAQCSAVPGMRRGSMLLERKKKRRAQIFPITLRNVFLFFFFSFFSFVPHPSARLFTSLEQQHHHPAYHRFPAPRTAHHHHPLLLEVKVERPKRLPVRRRLSRLLLLCSRALLPIHSLSHGEEHLRTHTLSPELEREGAPFDLVVQHLLARHLHAEVWLPRRGHLRREERKRE